MNLRAAVTTPLKAFDGLVLGMLVVGVKDGDVEGSWVVGSTLGLVLGATDGVTLGLVLGEADGATL